MEQVVLSSLMMLGKTVTLLLPLVLGSALAANSSLRGEGPSERRELLDCSSLKCAGGHYPMEMNGRCMCMRNGTRQLLDCSIHKCPAGRRPVVDDHGDECMCTRDTSERALQLPEAAPMMDCSNHLCPAGQHPAMDEDGDECVCKKNSVDRALLDCSGLKCAAGHYPMEMSGRCMCMRNGTRQLLDCSNLKCAGGHYPMEMNGRCMCMRNTRVSSSTAPTTSAPRAGTR